MQYLKILFIIILFSQNLSAQLQSAGSMSEMGKNNFASAIDLDTIKNKSNLYAIGPYGKMQGEITIFNGSP